MTTKKKIGISVLAVLVAGVVTVSALAISENVKDNGGTSYETTASESENGIVVNDGESRGLKLTAAALTAESLSSSYSATSSYTLTVSYNSSATSPSFTWTSTGSAITLTPSSDTCSCTVTCKSAFSSRITIKCTADDNANAYATCTVDYYKRATGSSLTLTNSGGSDFAFSSTSSSVTWTVPASSYEYIAFDSFTPSLGAGTISESYTATSLYIASYDGNYGGSWSLTASSNHLTFLFLITGIPVQQNYATALVAAVYDKLNTAYSAGTPYCTITLTFTGDTTGLTYSYDYSLYINPVNMYTSVSTASLSDTSIAF